VLSIVSAGLSLAEWHYWIDENPAESATMPSPGDHEPGGPTLEQAAALLASTTPPPQARQTARRHPPRLPQDRRWIRFGEQAARFFAEEPAGVQPEDHQDVQERLSARVGEPQGRRRGCRRRG
jgi:hypothetical protein